jgi:hypothetical protein
VFFGGNGSLFAPWRSFHEEGENGAESQNVNKFIAVVFAIRPRHGMVKHFE